MSIVFSVVLKHTSYARGYILVASTIRLSSDDPPITKSPTLPPPCLTHQMADVMVYASYDQGTDAALDAKCRLTFNCFSMLREAPASSHCIPEVNASKAGGSSNQKLHAGRRAHTAYTVSDKLRVTLYVHFWKGLRYKNILKLCNVCCWWYSAQQFVFMSMTAIALHSVECSATKSF